MPTRVCLNEIAEECSLWYNDGTVVVQAEDTVFRVYGGLLANQSTIFQDMFGVPQPLPQDIDTYEGCPLIHVRDSAPDMYHFLLVLHELE
jgi:hypothetical protein